MSIVIVYSDAIRELVRAIQNGIESQGLHVTCMHVNNIEISILYSADAIIFGCPSSFLPGVSVEFKNFMNDRSGTFHNQTWKDKLAGGFTTIHGQNSQGVLIELFTFACQNSMIWIPQGHLAENEGYSNMPVNLRTVNQNESFIGCIATNNQNDLTAYYFGLHFAQVFLHLA